VNGAQYAATHCNTPVPLCRGIVPSDWRTTCSKTLQHAATFGNALQHTATHCNTLQHAATHCNTLQHTATHCNTLQHTAIRCNIWHHTLTFVSWYFAENTKIMTYDMQQHTATHCNTPLPLCRGLLQKTPNKSCTPCSKTLQHSATFYKTLLPLCHGILQKAPSERRPLVTLRHPNRPLYIHISVSCSVLYCVAVCCSAVECAGIPIVRYISTSHFCCSVLHRSVLHCSGLQCVAVKPQHPATHCNTRHPNRPLHINKSRHTYARVMAQIEMSHGTRMNFGTNS